MSGLLRRLTRRRPATADETGSPAPESSEPAGATADTPAEPGGGQPVAAPSEQATQVLPQTAEQPAARPATGVEPAAAGGERTVVGPGETIAIIPVRDLPAGVDPTEYSDVPAASAPRGKLRRRLRYLRRVRDLLLRDLGGFTFEIHRTAGGTPTESHRKLVESKLNRIEALDEEVRALEGRLGEPHEGALLREPGIGGLCPECGALHSSDAHYCARCGAPLDAKARARREAAVAAAMQESAKPAAESAPASVLWAAGPRPGGAAPEPEPEEQRSEVTNRWLAVPRRGDDPVAAGDEARSEPVGDESVTGTPDEGAPATDAEATDEAATDTEGPATADEHAPTTDAVTTDEDATDEGASDKAVKDEPAGEGADDAPDFEPAPNGRRADDVPAPDPLPSRPERGA